MNGQWLHQKQYIYNDNKVEKKKAILETTYGSVTYR